MGQHRGSGRGPHTIEHASHLDAADLAQAVALRRDRLVARQRELAWSPGRADEAHTLGEVHRDLAALVDRRRAGAIPDGTPAELALAGADPSRLFADIPHLTADDRAALTTWAAWEASMITGRALAAALVAVVCRAVQVSRMRAPRASSNPPTLAVRQ